MTRQDQTARDRIEIERFADEVAQRCRALVRMEGAPGNQLAGRLHGEPDMLLRPEQDDVGERSLHGVPDPTSAVPCCRVRDVDVGRFGIDGFSC